MAHLEDNGRLHHDQPTDQQYQSQFIHNKDIEIFTTPHDEPASSILTIQRTHLGVSYMKLNLNT
ncbi:hypothetical protein DPMN_012590 [Dreissena polymorpha]|uniref:Uncharacterized protein n=1 Tax=Dreissena polymorpha TaxID=45954 RepID=A0A9D4N8A7_DREPO|nr:hypothetical protein DPMN_012590 [Dreissena polymorpha]